MAPTHFITGGSRGIGFATVENLLVHPSIPNVAALSRTKTPQLEALAAKYPGRLLIIQGDVISEEDIKNAIDLTIKTYGRLDGLILNSAVSGPLGKMGDPSVSLPEWQHTFDVNVFQLVRALKYATPHLRATKGRVVMVSSGSATGSFASSGPYNSSKAAMNSICRTYGAEEPDITSIALRPGVVETDMQSASRAKKMATLSPEDLVDYKANLAANPLLQPEVPGKIMVSLITSMDKKLSGGYYSWDWEEMKPYRAMAKI